MSVIDNSNLGTLWNRILGLFSARKINNKSLAKDITINDEDIPSTAVNGETTVEGALSNIADQLSNQSQQIAKLGATFWQVVVEDNMFVMYWHGVEAESPISVVLEGPNYVAYIES